MQTKTIRVLLVIALGWLAMPTSVWAFYNPTTGRWLSRDPIGEMGFSSTVYGNHRSVEEDPENVVTPGAGIQGSADLELYCFVNNDPLVAIDSFGLWELRCRPIAIPGVGLIADHCWIECGGHSYSLLNNNGTATKLIDDIRDRGKGEVVAQGPGKCKCIVFQFNLNKDSFTYDKDQCNSNYFANRILACCGINVSRPPKAWGWNDCNISSGIVSCSCYSGIVN